MANFDSKIRVWYEVRVFLLGFLAQDRIWSPALCKPITMRHCERSIVLVFVRVVTLVCSSGQRKPMGSCRGMLWGPEPAVHESQLRFLPWGTSRALINEGCRSLFRSEDLRPFESPLWHSVCRSFIDTNIARVLNADYLCFASSSHFIILTIQILIFSLKLLKN